MPGRCAQRHDRVRRAARSVESKQLMTDMTDADLGEPITLNARRIGLIADSHSDQDDGSDLPTEVFEALRGVDLVIDLGHTGSPGRLCRGVLDRLEDIAPVLS